MEPDGNVPLFGAFHIKKPTNENDACEFVFAKVMKYHRHIIDTQEEIRN